MEEQLAPRRLILALSFAAVWIVWGSTYLAIAMAIETLPPFATASIRFLVAGLGMLLFCRWRGDPWPNRQEWGGAALIGGLMLLGGNGLVTWAEQTVPSSIAALLITTVPLWMVFLDSVLFGGRRAGPRVWFGLALGFAGVVLLVRPSGGDVAGIPLAGSVALLLASFSWALGSLLSRRTPLPKSPPVALGAEMFAAGALLAAVSLARGEHVGFDPDGISTVSIAALLYLVVFGSLLALSAYMYLLREVSAAAVGTYAFVNPVVAVALGWWIADEPITPRVLAAGALIVVAVVVILLRKKKRLPKVASGSPAALDSA